MSYSVGTLFVCASAYLLLLFLVAYAAERRWLPESWLRHPLVYVLSLGVYASTWSYYGSVGFAAQQGILFIAIYLGVTLAFVLTPVLLQPILRLTRRHQLGSPADLFAFRYRSQLAGVLVTLMMLAGTLPYVALQIRAVAESTQVLTGSAGADPIALGFCLLIAVFAVVFGARHVTPREKHTGLVAAIAFESLFKLLALLTVAVVAVVMAFGSPAGLGEWLDANPERLEAFYRPGYQGPWISLLLITMGAAFLLPRQFHMIFSENLNPKALLTASWGFPLYLLLLALAVPPIVWAGQALQAGTAADYYVLGLAQLSGSRALTIFTYLGGISAASAMIIVAALAVSSMSLNHLLLPLLKRRPPRDLYAMLLWVRRALIGALIAASYGFYLLMADTEGLVAWGLVSFIAVAQLLPGVFGLLFWPRATRAGFIVGLQAGSLIWVFGALLPMISGADVFQWMGAGGDDRYATVTFWSLSVNTLLFALVSLLTRQSEGEREAAAACRESGQSLPQGALRLDSPEQFVARLAPVTGQAAARAEVDKALADLGLSAQERRPEPLHRLREQIESNLSGMMGPVLARMIVDERLELDGDTRAALARNVRLIEERLESSRSRLSGVAAELDRLRRYYRQILEDLPLGAIALTADGRVARLNAAMSRLTGIAPAAARGAALADLPAPWGAFLAGFMNEPVQHADKRALGERWVLSLHKAAIAEPGGNGNDTVLLVEDLSERQRLERELAHSERLASIGQLAAGVAHEIGNPVTGIACLAQDLKLDSDEPPVRESAELILEQTRRISRIVQTLVSYAHAGSREQTLTLPVQLREAAEEARRLIQLNQRARGLSFVNELPPALWVRGDAQRLVQVFVNLFSNAADACGGDGRITLSAVAEGGHARVEIADDGPGIPAALRDKVLEPFFTTKPAGRGTGLGLPLVYNIVKDHGGTLALDSDAQGTRVRLTLPLAEDVRIDAAATDH